MHIRPLGPLADTGPLFPKRGRRVPFSTTLRWPTRLTQCIGFSSGLRSWARTPTKMGGVEASPRFSKKTKKRKKGGISIHRPREPAIPPIPTRCRFITPYTSPLNLPPPTTFQNLQPTGRRRRRRQHCGNAPGGDGGLAEEVGIHRETLGPRFRERRGRGLRVARDALVRSRTQFGGWRLAMWDPNNMLT